MKKHLSIIATAIISAAITLSSCGGNNTAETNNVTGTQPNSQQPGIETNIGTDSTEENANETNSPYANVDTGDDGWNDEWDENWDELPAEGGLNLDDGEFVVENGVLTSYKGESKNVVIPDGVTEIGNGVFCFHRWLQKGIDRFEISSVLESVVIPEGVTKIGKEAFQECNYLVSVSLPSTLKVIDDNAFNECHELTDEGINIPENIERIGIKAFAETKIDKVTLPSSLKYIDRTSFINTPLYNAYMLSGNQDLIIDDVLLSYNSYSEETVFPDGIRVIAGQLFYTTRDDGSGSQTYSIIKSIKIPESVKYIGTRAFGYYDNINELILPDGLLGVDDCALENCKRLKAIPSSLTEIGNKAFEGCVSLEAVNITSSEVSLGESAFKDCVSLTSVTLPEGLSKIKAGMFEGCASLKELNLPDSVLVICDSAFKGCEALDGMLKLPAQLKLLGTSAFEGTGISGVELPKGLRRIGKRAFSRCTNLGGDLFIPGRVKSIGEEAFKKTSLDSLTISDNVLELGKGTFSSSTIRTLYYYGKRESWEKLNINKVINNGLVKICDEMYYQSDPTVGVTAEQTTEAEDDDDNDEPEIDLTGFVTPDPSEFTWIDNGPEYFYFKHKETDTAPAELRDAIVITGYTGQDNKIIIPAEIDGKPVSKVSFDDYGNVLSPTVTDIVIPEGVKIANILLFNSSIENLILPQTLEEIVITGLSIKTITLPKRLGKVQISNCDQLEEIKISSKKELSYGPYDNYSNKHKNTYFHIYDCSKLKYLELPDNTALSKDCDYLIESPNGDGTTAPEQIIYLGQTYTDYHDLDYIIPKGNMYMH